MSTALAPFPVRLFCDRAAVGSLSDLNTGEPPVLYRGYDWEIDIGIGLDGNLDVPNLTGYTSVTAQIYAAENDTNSAMVASTVLAAAMNLTLTQTLWNNGINIPSNSNAHAAFVIPNGQTSIPLNGQASITYWLKIFATSTTGQLVPLLEGPIVVKDGPISTVSSTPNQGFKVVPVNGINQIAYLFPDGKYYLLLPEIDAGGTKSFGVSDQNY